MSRLIKPSEYAKEKSISRQAVYAKIKKGLLQSKTVDGKIYIVLEESALTSEKPPAHSSKQEVIAHTIDPKELLASKDETIAVLKDSIQDLKQTNTEINTTLRGEIELLKQVFAELRTLYVKQVNTLSSDKVIMLNEKEDKTHTAEIEAEQEEECWIDLKSFLERQQITKEKKQAKVKKRLLKAYHNNDNRIRMEDGNLLLSCYDFYEDILKTKPKV